MDIVGYFIHFAIALVIVNKEVPLTRGMLYPQQSETRDLRSLDGLWNFVKSDQTNPTQGIREKWFDDDLSKAKDVIPMPVPASYNDITTDNTIRDHVGTVWYDRKFFVPRFWAKDQRLWLRFGSVHYEAFVWINGEMIVKHEMGHLPFEAEITDFVRYGEENRITVMCDNALIQTTVPQGKISEVKKDGGVAIVQTYTFDFFNYAGIHRSVHLYTTPKTFIEEVEISTDLVENSEQLLNKGNAHGKGVSKYSVLLFRLNRASYRLKIIKEIRYPLRNACTDCKVLQHATAKSGGTEICKP